MINRNRKDKSEEPDVCSGHRPSGKLPISIYVIWLAVLLVLVILHLLCRGIPAFG